jgi:hypothetical protein
VPAFALVNLAHVERRIREHLDALGPGPRAELLRVLMLPRLRAGRPDRRVLGQPEDAGLRRAAVDCEEDRILRAVLVGMLRDADRSGPS